MSNAYDIRQDYINNIQGLFPSDSDFKDTATTGQRLLLEAIFRNWRSLPTEILEDYSRACNYEEMRQSRGSARQQY